MNRRPLLAAVVTAVVLAAGLFGALVVGQDRGTAHPLPTRGPLVVVGTAGLSWNDVSPGATPALWSMLQRGASAAMTVRSVHSNTCPVDGWLTVSAGSRAGDVEPPGGAKPPCRAVPALTGPGPVPRWDAYAAAAAARSFGSTVGLLGQQLTSHGRCVQAIGPGAAIAAATTSGQVTHYTDFAGPLPLSTCPVTIIDVGSVRDPADVDPADEVQPTASRAVQVAAVDRRVAEVLRAAPADAQVLVASLADAGRSERLRPVALTGPEVPAGSLFSTSTRQPALIQLSDLTATVLAEAGVPVPAEVGGAPLEVTPVAGATTAGARERLQALTDYDQASHEVHNLVQPFFNGWVYLQLGIYLLVAVVWRRRWGSSATRWRLLRTVAVVAAVASTVPVSTFLANLLPWWRYSSPLLAVVGSVGVFVLAISALALLGPWRRWLFGPLTVVSTVTLVVLAMDVMTGSRLQLSSLMGLQPVVAGRFYGMGNVTFALFATADLLLCTAVANRLRADGRRGLAAASVLVIGLAAVLVDASPMWGSDFGGPPALLPGLAYLLLAVLDIRFTWRKGLLVLAGTVTFLVVVAVLDWLRPVSSQSHLGRFVQTVIDGGAWDVIRRKGAQNLAILFGNPLSLLVPVGLFLVIYILARPTSWGARSLDRAYERAPLLRPGLISLVITLTLGFALNDSGVAIPAVGATLAIPLVIAVSVRSLEDEDQEEADRARPVVSSTQAPR